jgi:hypothetical protein
MQLDDQQKLIITKSFSCRGYTVKFDDKYVILIKGKKIIKIPQKDYAKLLTL